MRECAVGLECPIGEQKDCLQFEGDFGAEGVDTLQAAKEIGNYLPKPSLLVSRQTQIFRPCNLEPPLFDATLQTERFVGVEAGPFPTLETQTEISRLRRENSLPAFCNRQCLPRPFVCSPSNLFQQFAALVASGSSPLQAVCHATRPR